MAQQQEVIEKSAVPEREICANCKHEKAEHNKVISILKANFDYCDCKHSIIFKGCEYKCTCKEFVR
jgi:hypothetical protein